MPPTPIAALFDAEGTLIDCVALQLESWRVTLGEAGYSFTHLDLQPFSGMDGLCMLDHLLPNEPRDCKERLLEVQGESYRRREKEPRTLERNPQPRFQLD